LPKGAKFCPSCGAPVGRVVKEELSVSSEDLVKKVKELIHLFLLYEVREFVLLELPLS